MERVNWSRVRDILICIICIAILLWATFTILSIFVHVIVLLLLAMAVAFLITPPVDFLHRYIPRGLAALAVYIVVLAILGGFFYALFLSLIQQVNYFSNNLPGYVQNLPNTYSTFQQWLIKQGVPQTAISKALSTITDQANAFALSLASNLVSVMLIIADIIINALVVTVLSFYLTVDGKRVRDSIFSIVPKRAMPHVLLFEDALNRVVGNYIRGQTDSGSSDRLSRWYGHVFPRPKKFLAHHRCTGVPFRDHSDGWPRAGLYSGDTHLAAAP